MCWGHQSCFDFYPLLHDHTPVFGSRHCQDRHQCHGKIWTPDVTMYHHVIQLHPTMMCPLCYHHLQFFFQFFLSSIPKAALWLMSYEALLPPVLTSVAGFLAFAQWWLVAILYFLLDSTSIFPAFFNDSLSFIWCVWVEPVSSIKVEFGIVLFIMLIPVLHHACVMHVNTLQCFIHVFCVWELAIW